MKTMSKEESMLSDLEMSARSLERHIDIFKTRWRNDDIKNKVYHVINYIEEEIEHNPNYKSIYK